MFCNGISISFFRAFPERCQIDEKSNTVQTDSVTSTDSSDDGLMPIGFAIVGDDFMQSLISFELFGGDFTDKHRMQSWINDLM